jgi:putative ABC transport system permease protein
MLMGTVWQDLRYSLRMFRQSPGFTAVVILSLALGIGANTAIFSLTSAVLLKPLPFREPERLVMLWEDASFAGFPRNTPSPANFMDWKAQSESFEGMAALAIRSYNLTDGGDPVRLEARAVTADFFPVLGVKPALGRAFAPAEDRPGGDRVAVISHAVWQGRYGGDPGVVGREILLGGEKRTVVGVMPARFQFLDEVDVWVPLALSAEAWASRGRHYLTVVARLKPGVTIERANADLRTIMARIRRDYPNEAGRTDAYALALDRQVTGGVRGQLVMLLVAVGFVLLIACANIANLLLARAAARGREIAVRLALGAGRTRLVRQLLTESVLLALAGGTLGLLFAAWSFAFLQQLVPAEMALTTSLKLDGRTLGFTLGVAVFAGLLFGLAPALQASRSDLNEALKQGGGRAGTSAGSRRLRSAFVVAEVALALMLLVGAGLLIQTLYRLHSQYSVLRPESLLTVRTELPRPKYREHAERVAFYSQVLGRVRRLPGVESAGYTTSVPLVWKGGTSGFLPEGRQPLPGLSYDANHRQVSADYLQTTGIPLRRGRYIEERDVEQSQAVAVINETMARQYWPDEDPLGKRFTLGDPGGAEPWITVVGVVADVRQMGLDEPVKAEMYLPFRQLGYMTFYAPRELVIRSAVDPTSLVAAVRREVQAVDAEQPVSHVRTMADILGAESGEQRVGMVLLSAFAALALLLAGLGIYGVLAYFVAQHTPEIGIRMALGAARGDILALVLRKGMGMAMVGVAVGLGGAFALMRLMQSLLYGVSASDPLTFAGVAAVLAGVALAACWIPARRAARVDPMVALRRE